MISGIWRTAPISSGRILSQFSIAVFLVAGVIGEAGAGLRHGVIWYSAAPDEATRRLAADRYELGVTGRDVKDVGKIKAIKPDFKWFVYNSVTDNYVPPHSGGTPEHDALMTLARKKKVDPEAVYLHYHDDTVIVLRGDTLRIPGWKGGSAGHPREARIPVYYSELTRRVANFSTPEAAAVHRQVILDLAFGSPFEGTHLYPDGLFLDNSAAELFNFGSIVSGGRVQETPGMVSIDSKAFRDWHWDRNLGPFLSSLKDTLENSANWSPDGARKEVMINVSNVWSDSYVTGDAADILFMEFQYNPVRNFGKDLVAEAFRRDELASGAGIACFYSSPIIMSLSGVDGSYTRGEAMLGNLAWFLVTRNDPSIFFEMGSSTPHVAGWDTLTWRGSLDVANIQLGEAVGPPYVLARGRDPLGNDYVITARNYESGLAAVRNRGDWNQGIERGTAVEVELPAPLAPVDAEGKIRTVVRKTAFRNGEGKIFLGDPGR